MERDYKGLTPEQKYDLLTRDFLERDGDTFVRIRTSDRLGWESTIPEDGAYSAVILNPKSERELYLNAVNLARQMIVAMNTPFRVNVRVSPKRSCTDGHTVYVATKVFDDPELPLGKKLDTFLGLTVHEGSHLLYTDFKELEKNDNIIVHKLQNIFEDERIERELGEQKPGLANFLKATKYYYFDLYEKRQEEEKVEPNDATRLFNAILSLVRYPARLDVEDAKRFADELLQVRDLLTPYPESTRECIEVAKEVYELLKKFIANPPKPEQKRRQEQGGSQDASNDKDDREEKDNRPDKGKESDNQNEDNGQEGDNAQDADNNQKADDKPSEGQSGESDSSEEDRSQENGNASDKAGEDDQPEDESENPEGTEDLPEDGESDGDTASGSGPDSSEDERASAGDREEESGDEDDNNGTDPKDEDKNGQDDEDEDSAEDGDAAAPSTSTVGNSRKQCGDRADTDSSQGSGQEQDATDTGESPADSGETAGQEEPDENVSAGEDEQEDEQEEFPPVTDEEIGDILKSIIEALDELSGHEEREPGDAMPEEDAAQALQEDSLVAKECDGELEIGHCDDTIVVKEQPNRPRFEQSLARVRKYIPAIAAALRSHGTSYSYIVTGTRSGLLDTNKLCEARQGVQNVYMRKGEVKADRLNVALVIDESGSMQDIREQLARDTAVLVNEAVGNLRDISLHIYGYTGDWTNAYLIPYREGRTLQDRHVLGSITSRGGTPTAKAMSEALWRIRRSSREKGIMLVISDGMADGGTAEVRNATDSLQKQGFEVIGISISSTLTKDNLAQMYDHYVVMDRLDNLASELGKTVKAAILRLSKRTIS